MGRSIDAFVTESNKIEGIERDPKESEIHAHERLFAVDSVTIQDLELFVGDVQPGAELRQHKGMDVVIGAHHPPPGGSRVIHLLTTILEEYNEDLCLPYDMHIAYELLHPFVDGNGRSGRALWAWHMLKHGIWPGIRLGFLHAFYYQTLSAHR